MITFVPAGGLGNRMKSMAAAIRLAQTTQSKLDIIWFQDWGLGCRFDQLFQPLNISQTQLREATLLDKVMRDIPRKRNLYIPKLFEHCLYDDCLDRIDASKAYYKDFDFTAWCKGKKVWLASDVYFIAKEIPDDSFDIYHPVSHLQKRINQIKEDFSQQTIGVHIRRTDNIRSIQNSPTHLFIERMHQEPDDVKFYLATDSEEVKGEMRSFFGNRIITSPNRAARGNLEGMEDALVEMYLLAATNRILGSSCSTYSMTAASIGRVPLEIIEKFSNV
ncbi:MAG: glycosyl transferase [Prevotella sp.]|nr:glycosyl transferase [Prevotella sp.]